MLHTHKKRRNIYKQGKEFSDFFLCNIWVAFKKKRDAEWYKIIIVYSHKIQKFCKFDPAYVDKKISRLTFTYSLIKCFSLKLYARLIGIPKMSPEIFL